MTFFAQKMCQKVFGLDPSDLESIVGSVKRGGKYIQSIFCIARQMYFQVQIIPWYIKLIKKRGLSNGALVTGVIKVTYGFYLEGLP